MDRFVLTDAHWTKMASLCLGKKTDRGRSGKDNRLFIEAVLRIARPGNPWRDLPPVFRTLEPGLPALHRLGRKSGIFQRISEAVSGDTDMEYAMARRYGDPGSLPRAGGKRGTGKKGADGV
ncbi:transposase [Komagataeibacter diospyri]|uniref:transposase n=1 Tax=Komagataeibacter diospyri TaxID=1932662 RepID=UPI001D03FC86